jgi:hypothetical protein
MRQYETPMVWHVLFSKRRIWRAELDLKDGDGLIVHTAKTANRVKVLIPIASMLLADFPRVKDIDIVIRADGITSDELPDDTEREQKVQKKPCQSQAQQKKTDSKSKD